MSTNDQQNKDTFWWRLIHLNPSIWKGVIVSVVALIAVFGVHVSSELPDALDGFIAALSVLVQAVWVKSSVTPNAQVVVAVENPHTDSSIVVPGEAVTTASSAQILEAAATAGPDGGSANGNQ